MVHPVASAGFDKGADAYERGRPGYPAATIRWLGAEAGLGPGKTVLDLAAGTGKLTRLLVPTGARVVAVEPVAGMRARLAGTGAEVLDGTAEAIPVPDASADLVTVAQAFHWFDGERALAEIHRVLRERGGLAIVWNLRDLEQPIQARLEELLSGHRGSTPAHRSGRWRKVLATTALFTPGGEHRFRHHQLLDGDGLVDRIASISFVAAMEPHDRDVLLSEVQALAEGRAVRLDYEAEISLYRRTGG